MDNYTFREYAVMHLIPGKARGSGAADVRFYEKGYA
jgi:hypothetical protein